MQNRVIERLRDKMRKLHYDGFIVSGASTIAYVTGFFGLVPSERESYAVCIDEKTYLIVPRLYQEEALRCKSDLVEIVIDFERTGLFKTAVSLLQNQKCKTVGFESGNLIYNEYLQLKELLPNCTLCPDTVLFQSLRRIKSTQEIQRIRQAQEISYKAYEKIIPHIKPGITEFEVREMLVRAMCEFGAEGESFDAIIAFGQHSAQPHYKTGQTRLKKGDMILLDFGARYKGYCGDTTRMLFLGTPSDEQAKKYLLVKRAQEEAIQHIRAGISGEEAFNFSADVFREGNVLEYFTHGLGHGIGLDVHEEPYLRTGMHVPIEENMVFSVEPGLYFNEWGGIRIEDLVVCRKDAVEILGNNSIDLRVI